ncbi:MAG: VCBS repeat-containing protein [Phycisphaerae bacterium]
MGVEQIVILFTITFLEGQKLPTPVRIDLDFDRVLAPREIRGLIDPHTLTVKRRINNRVTSFAVQFDERLYTGNHGWVAWRVEDPQAGGEWWLEVKLRASDGRLARAPDRPMVGVGDELYYNGDRWHPICVPGMHQFPIPVDWNGDDLIDVISSSHYSNTQGMPWAGIFYWRNIGGNDKPRFAPPMRLSAEGVERQDAGRYLWGCSGNINSFVHFKPRRDFISESYIRCDVYDWFGTGRQDLITLSREGGIRVYRNTGKRDGAGMPELELAVTIPLPETLPPSPYCGLRVIDWDGSGRPSILFGVAGADFGVDYGQMLLFLNGGGSKTNPKFKIIPLSRSDRPVDPAIKDFSKLQNFIGMRGWSFDVFDLDQDGRKEILFCHGSQTKFDIEVWKNVGTLDRPVMMQQGKLPWSRHYTSFGFRFVKNAAFDGCLVGNVNSGAGFRYFKRVKDDPFDPEAFRDAGLLLGEGCKVRVEGYVRPSPVDLMGQGRMDMVCGDESGFITLIKNIGTKERPAFSDPQKVTDARGNVIHLCRENILHDGDLEAACGQLKPQVCDWDGDGQLDIIVANNTNRILWLKGYNPKTNKIQIMTELKVKGVLDPFGWRKGMAIGDFDGDKKLELVTADPRGQICLFKQTRDPGVLAPAVPLTYTDGKVLTVNDVPPNHYKPQLIWMYAADWTGSGTPDLFVGSNMTVSFLENVGIRKKPVFKKAIQLTTPDGPIMIGHHETQPAVYDWDGDGRPDLMIGGENGGIYLFHRDWLEGKNPQIRIERIKER